LRGIGVEMLKEQVSRNIRCSFFGTT
jgi:hypothetical protein